MRFLVHTARPIFEDLVGTLTFYLLFVLTGSAALSAVTGLVIGAAQALRHKVKGEPVPGLLLIGIALTISLGGLSRLTHNSRFILLKPASSTVAWAPPWHLVGGSGVTFLQSR